MHKIVKALSVISLLGLIACVTPQAGQLSDLNIAKIDAENPPAIRELNFQSYGKRLNGFMYQANGTGPHPTVVLLHGYPGNEKNLDLAQALRRDGFNVLFFHYRGSWGSEGNFSFNHVIEDVGSAIQFLRGNAEDYRVDVEQLTLIGHSMGGFAALQGAAKDPNVRCVAGLAAANFGGRKALLDQYPEVTKGFAVYADNLQMLEGWSGRQVISEMTSNSEAFNLNDLAPALSGKSVLLIAGDKDEAVSAERTHKPMAAAYQAQDGLQLTQYIISGDHSFSWSRGTLIQNVLDWADHCR